MFRHALALIAVLLALFHAWLFGSQWSAGELAEPGLVLRWAFAGGVLAALSGLRRRGDPMVSGRRAVCIWLLAALLHGPAMAAARATNARPALPEAVTALVQIAAASLTFGLGLALLAALASRPLTGLHGRPHPALLRAGGTSDRERSPRFSPRPPPVYAPFDRW